MRLALREILEILGNIEDVGIYGVMREIVNSP